MTYPRLPTPNLPTPKEAFDKNPITATKNLITSPENPITATKNTITAAIILHRSFLPMSACY